ncbi:putative Calcium-transporting ATPase [Rhodotorula toruloides ATCC 204091]|uniref:Calcium-transporting ATPase 2 n=1 Tax=Rhodotorula toruloides TaxID=5286 RepID=A0A0K3C6V1_RHOTO|nr:putative Calcium-transporting ATPase [Rhodotorula toruloides ATCC 204091]PRQ77563.1 putative calcium-transporting ATPase [Rhodotorula toruloides]
MDPPPAPSTPPLAPPIPTVQVSPAPDPTPSATEDSPPSSTERRLSLAPTVASSAGASGTDAAPPSPTPSSEPLFNARTTTSLRDNLDAPSFASTVPDSNDGHAPTPHVSNACAPKDLEAGLDAAGKPLTATGDGLRDASSPGVEDTALPADEEKKSKILGIFPRRAKKPQEVYKIHDPPPEEMAPFDTSLTPSALYNLVDPKSFEHMRELGGVKGILGGLKTDAKVGLQEAGGEGAVAEGEDRRRVYGENRVPGRKPKSFLALCWAAYTDKVLIILSVAAIVSLALGLYQDLGTPPDTYFSTSCPPTNMCTEPQVDWVEGVAITVAILIVVLVGSVNDYQKERQFQKLNAQKEERSVKVLRGGQERLMSVYDVVVGDILFLEPGEIVPVDGIFLGGHNVRCDESGATGESDAVRKAPYDEIEAEGGKGKTDCFMISGSKVLEGVGKYVVTSVGMNSFHGKIMMSLQGDTEDTPLQLKLNALAELIAKLGSAAGLLLFTALMIRFFVQLKTMPDRSANDKAQAFIQVLIIAVTVVVVAVPEGLPLAVTLALAFATRRMTKMNLLVRVLGACETMANATCVCTDKTGTLTTNKMTVVAGSIGVHLKFADRLAENSKRTNANDDRDPEKVVEDEKAAEEAADPQPRKGRLDFSADMTAISSHASPALRKLLNDSIVINSTAFEGTDEHGATGGFVGSKTETALMSFAQAQGWPHYRAVREGAHIVQMVPFSSERKCMGVVVQLPNGKHRLYLKGASEVLAKLSTRHVTVQENGGEAGSEDDDVPTAEFDDETRGNISRTIIFYACQSLRTIALCSRDFASWPPKGAQTNAEGEVAYEDMANDLTLIAITAIEDPLREGVAKAVATCQRAGVMVKMCTGDNVLTARSIATQCGIFTKGGIIMEGPVFRKLSDSQRLSVVPNLQVLARSSPEDKKILVETLKSMGEVVGVTGDGTNDGPALKTANVGFSMGIAGTEVAKEASDIILMDDNFASIVSAIMWGRCVNDSVRKFLQFQLSVNITAVVITFVTAVASEEESSVLTAVQLLWVNLIMDTFAALALATDPADPESLERKPDRKTAPLISVQMWIMIIGQAIYQIVVALVLNFAGHQILSLDSSDPGQRIDQDNELMTLIFNAFVFSQIFNMLNARRLDRKLNIFVGIHRNIWFMLIFVIMVGGQALIVNVGGAAFQVVRIGGRDWAISIIIGLISLPIAVLLRMIPPEPVERFMVRAHLYPDLSKTDLPSVNKAAEEYKWAEGIQRAIDGLKVYSTVRGGRARATNILKFRRPRSRAQQLRAMDMQPTHLLAMVPTLVIGSVGAGWRPESGSLDDPAAHDPSLSTQQLVEKGLGQLQPMSPRGAHSRSPSMSTTLPPVKE